MGRPVGGWPTSPISFQSQALRLDPSWGRALLPSPVEPETFLEFLHKGLGYLELGGLWAS